MKHVLRFVLVSTICNAFRVSPSVSLDRRPVRPSGQLAWDSAGMDVVTWLVGRESELFLAHKFGRHWHYKSWLEPRVKFSVEENLQCLKNFDPGPARMEHIMRMQRYILDPDSVKIKDCEEWANVPMKFWSATMCRSKPGCPYEDISDEARIAEFLMSRHVFTADDLRDYGENYTFILNQVHGTSQNLQNLHHALWAFFGLSGGINSYVTPGFAAGKAPHTDDHDVFVVQQGGEKLWMLYDDDMKKVTHEVTVKPGSVLYLPLGVPHCARSVSADPSLHLAVSVSRTSFTGAGVLAGWLELKHASKVSRDNALQIQQIQGRLMEGGSPWDPLSQLLPDSRPLLRAFDATDLPPQASTKAAEYLIKISKELAIPRLLGLSSNQAKFEGAQLQRLISEQRAEQQVMKAFWALREHFFEEHYMIHMPLALPEVDMETSLPSETGDLASKRWRRPASTAALLMRDGSININGYRTEVPAGSVEALRFCMGVNTGARNLPFSFDDIPGSVNARRDALRLLLRFRGVELLTQ